MDSSKSTLDSFLASLGLEAWVTEVFIIVFLTLLVNFIQKRLLGRLARKLETTRNPWDDAVIASLQKPLTALV